MTKNEMTDAGLTLPVGTVDDAREWSGRTSDTRFADERINESMVRLFASVLEDANPSYWEERFADQTWGGLLGPPGMLLTWKMPALWTPDRDDPTPPIYGLEVPLPAEKDMLLLIETESTFERPMFVGDRLTWQETILRVSDEKETRVGTGHFVTSEATFHNQDGEHIADNTATIFRHERPDRSVDTGMPYARGRRSVDADTTPPPRDRYHSRLPGENAVGDTVPSFELPVTYERVIQNVAATREFLLPGLYDPEYARSQGNETVFLNAIALHGLLDRLATDWAGPEWRVVGRSMRILGSAVAGECLVGTGDVTAVDDGTVTIEAMISVRDGEPVCEGAVGLEQGSDW